MGKSLGNVVIEVQSGASLFARKGWQNVLESIGYTCHIYNIESSESINDFWDKLPEISLFLGTTYNLSRPLIKQIHSRPDMKVALYCSAYGVIADSIDKTKYPIQIVSEEEKRNVELIKDRVSCVHIHTTDTYLQDYIGGWKDNLGIHIVSIMNGADLFTYTNAQIKDEYKSQISYCGGCWGYKSINLNKSLVRLCREEWQNYKIKVFGQGWDIPQYIGLAPFGDDAHIFASTKICPNISEPHSIDILSDLIERLFKVPISNGFLISDKAIGLEEIFDDKCPTFTNYEEFKALIDFYLKPENGLHRLHLMNEQRKRVWANHTYFERMSKLLQNIGLSHEAILCLNKKQELFPFTH